MLAYRKFSRGFIIKDLQEKLGVNNDGIFGDITERRIIDFKLNNRGYADYNVFESLNLTWPGDFYRLLNVISCFEGTGFDTVESSVQTNDNAGITFGLIGFTSFNGELQRLCLDLFNNDECKDIMLNILGDEFNTFLSVIKSSDYSLMKKTYVVNGRVKQLIVNLFKELGKIKVVKDLQIKNAYDRYYSRVINTANLLKISSLQYIGFLFDIYVQNGLPQYIIDIANKKRYNELQKCEIILNLTLDRINKKYHTDVISRKRTWIDGVGIVHGLKYDLKNYAIIDFDNK